MSVFNDIAQGVKNYYHHIPSNTGKQMIIAAGAGFIMETIITGNVTQGLIVAGLSALATAIYGLVTPIFKWLNGGSKLSWPEEMCRTFTAIIGAACVARAFGNHSIFQKLPSIALVYGIAIALVPSMRCLHSTNWMVIFPKFTIG